jgi:hypothetical protein
MAVGCKETQEAIRTTSANDLQPGPIIQPIFSQMIGELGTPRFPATAESMPKGRGQL